MFLRLISESQTVQIQFLTEDQVSMIVSLQDSLFFENGRYKVKGKMKQGGHLNIERIRKKFFSSVNSIFLYTIP